MSKSTQAVLRKVIVHFADLPDHIFTGYTDGRRWNGFACPHLPISELRRVLEDLIEWGDEQRYEVIDDQHVRVYGLGGEAYTMSAKIQPTTDGARWLFDCGGAWTFVDAARRF